MRVFFEMSTKIFNCQLSISESVLLLSRFWGADLAFDFKIVRKLMLFRAFDVPSTLRVSITISRFQGIRAIV